MAGASKARRRTTNRSCPPPRRPKTETSVQRRERPCRVLRLTFFESQPTSENRRKTRRTVAKQALDGKHGPWRSTPTSPLRTSKWRLPTTMSAASEFQRHRRRRREQQLLPADGSRKLFSHA